MSDPGTEPAATDSQASASDREGPPGGPQDQSHRNFFLGLIAVSLVVFVLMAIIQVTYN